MDIVVWVKNNWLVNASLALGVIGLSVGGAGAYQAVKVTRELHQLEYTVRHDLGDPDAGRLGEFTRVGEVGADGRPILIPCKNDPAKQCQKTHLVRQTALEEMQALDGRIHAIEAKTDWLNEWDYWFYSSLNPEILRAQQDEWHAKHDSDGDGFWSYGDIIDDCPNDNGYLARSPDDTLLHGCPDKDGNSIADKFDPIAPAEVEDADPIEPLVPEGPLDGDVLPGDPGFDQQVSDFCSQNPEKRSDGKFYLTGCKEGGKAYEDKTFVCTSWDSTPPYLHGCDIVQ
jgi:hypothetical protein